MKHGTGPWLSVVALVSMFVPGVGVASLYGNDSAATARPIMADGITYVDQLTAASPDAWFAFRIDPNQSYAVEVWSPYGKLQTPGNLCYVTDVLESDGTSFLPATARPFDTPSPQVQGGLAQGSRLTFVASGNGRVLTLRVRENGLTLPAPSDCAIRVITTTLVAARWSVNGYNDYFALSNASSTSGFNVSGSILYYDEGGALVGSDPFALAANGSVQIVKPNGVPIGGAVRGGVRIVHDGAPGTIIAHQTLFSPGTGQFIQYPFQMLVHSYGRGGI